MPRAVPNFLSPLLAQPVAVFGGGVSGQGVLELLRALDAAGTLFDEQGGERGAPDFGAAGGKKHPLVVFSPGFAPEHPWLAAARRAGSVCLGELDFASLFWRGRLVAVTGTNGKTTLTEFLAHALRSAGRSVLVTGNIGVPLSRLAASDHATPDQLAVCEVSSFQAETLRHFHAEAALWTNFAEDHLERHPGMEAYFAAKWNLFDHTEPGAVFAGSSVVRFARAFARALPATAAVASEGLPPDERLAGTVFARYPQRENFELARAWWSHAGLPAEVLFAAARSFRLGRHRLERVGEHDGAVFWNDSKGTNFHAVEGALAGFDRPVLLIAGGKSKGGDLAGFVRRIAPQVKHALLIGETRSVLATFCTAYHVPHTVCATLAEAVRRAADLAGPGDQVLLSPGFASFDMFRNYGDRGVQFETLVHNLGTTAILR